MKPIHLAILLTVILISLMLLFSGLVDGFQQTGLTRFCALFSILGLGYIQSYYDEKSGWS
jgi:hypothetical protein